MVQTILRGMVRGFWLAPILLSFNLFSSTIITLDPYDDTSHEVDAAFRDSNYWVRNLPLKLLNGIPATDEELNMHKVSTNFLSNYRFEEIAEENLNTAFKLREALPNLLTKHADHNTALISSIFEVMSDYYRNHSRIANQDDVEKLEAESILIQDLIEYLSKNGHLNIGLETLSSELQNEVQKSIQAGIKVPYKRHSYYNEDGIFRPYSEVKDFSGERTDASFPELEDGVSIKEHIQKFREKIREHAAGQPEVENALVRMEMRRLMGMRDEAPQKLWLMGLPGVGKDTYVNAFAHALHPTDPLAHRKHVYNMDVCKSESDMSSLFGAGKKYVGSETLPKLVRFLVQHSGGKLQILKDANKYEYVALGADPDMKYFNPEDGILFVNEFHDWNPQAANDILKQFIETGRIPVRSSGGANDALSEIYVPVRVVFASNDGIDILRDRNFSRNDPPSFTKIMERWLKNHKKIDELRARIVNRGENLLKAGHIKGRLSDEFMSRFLDSEMILMRPLSRETLIEIARLSINHLRKIMSGMSRALGGVSFNFTPAAIETIVDHHSRSDDGARRLKGGIQSYFVEPILDSVADGLIEPSDKVRNFDVNFVSEETGDISLDLQEKSGLEHHRIVVDEAEVKANIFDPAFLKRFDDFEVAFKNKIFGAHHLARQIRESLYLTEHYILNNVHKAARKFSLYGLSSTGKTQVAKEIARFYFGTSDGMENISFDNVSTEQDLRDLIYGTKNGDPSPFMEAYDRNSGKCLILLDEVINVAHPSILKVLYKILDEAEVNGFNDGKARSMEGVIFVLTGNAGQEAFNVIPRHIPNAVQRQAQLDIYEMIENDPNAKRVLAERYMPQALYNRQEASTSHFMPPLSHEALRRLMHDKIADVFARLNLSLAKVNSSLTFSDQESYLKFINDAEESFFDVWRQGRSIENFSTDLEKRLLLELSKSNVQNVGEIALKYTGSQEVELGGKKRSDLNFKLVHANNQNVADNPSFSMQGLNVESKVTSSKAELLQTAIHEAGHEIAFKALFGDTERSVKLSIVPGLALIGTEYVYYAGIAVSEVIQHRAGTRQFYVARLARLYAGAEAQRLVNKGAQADMGGSNDNMRADTYAAMALLAGGVDDKWGLESPHEGETVKEYLERISETKREAFEKAKSQIKKEAHALANQVLRSNLTALMALGRELSRVGEMKAPEIAKFYEEHPVKAFYSQNGIVRTWNRWTMIDNWKSWFWNKLPASYAPQPKVLAAYVPDVEKAEVKMPEDILAERKAAEVSNVEIPKSIPFSSCRTILSAN